MKITEIAVNNQMMCNYYNFNCSKEDFERNMHDSMFDMGYFSCETIDGVTLILNPKNCAFIEIRERDQPDGE